MQRPNPSSRGFTLAEVIVVVVVVAIAGAMIVPYAVGATSSEAVGAARTIAGDLQYAQNVAISTQKKITVTFNGGARSYTLSNQSGSLIQPMTKAAYTVNFATLKGYSGLTSLSATFGAGSAVVFDETGAPDNAGSVTVQAGRVIYRVDVAAATGNVTVAQIGS